MLSVFSFPQYTCPFKTKAVLALSLGTREHEGIASNAGSQLNALHCFSRRLLFHRQMAAKWLHTRYKIQDASGTGTGTPSTSVGKAASSTNIRLPDCAVHCIVLSPLLHV
jgi:hypothetical protein